jgi:prephenate dehydratase
MDHKRGSLAAVLNVMSDCKMNLKIQSLPKVEIMEIFFFIDVTFESMRIMLKQKRC